MTTHKLSRSSCTYLASLLYAHLTVAASGLLHVLCRAYCPTLDSRQYQLSSRNMSDQTTEPDQAPSVPISVNKEQLSLEVSEAIWSDNIIVSRGEEQALESHEVIELQTFSERKAWIEDKIKVGALASICAKSSHCM